MDRQLTIPTAIHLAAAIPALAPGIAILLRRAS